MLVAPATGSIELTLPNDNGRKKRAGVVVHRSARLSASAVTRRRGIPVTSPVRTLRDIMRSVPHRLYLRAVRRAIDLGLVESSDLPGEPALTRSELERRFLALCRRNRIPVPEVNVMVGGYEVDFLWRAERVVAETDGFRFHSDRAAFELDRARDADLQAQGYRVLRFTYRQVMEAPRVVVARLRGVMG
jgi:very-short-patch-repair endonuclease